MVNIIDLAITFTINKVFALGINKGNLINFNKEFKKQIYKYSETYFRNTYEYLTPEQEFDFYELNSFLSKKIDRDSLLRFNSYSYYQRKIAIECFVEDVYNNACANTEKKRIIVDTYLTIIIEIIERFFICENKLPEAMLANRNIDDIASLISDLKKSFTNDIARLYNKNTFANFIELLALPAQSKNPFHYLNGNIGFYGREKEISYLTQFINDERQILCAFIVGNAGVGKSKLMKEFINIHKNNSSWKMILCNHSTAKKYLTLSHTHIKNAF